MYCANDLHLSQKLKNRLPNPIGAQHLPQAGTDRPLNFSYQACGIENKLSLRIRHAWRGAAEAAACRAPPFAPIRALFAETIWRRRLEPSNYPQKR